MPVVALRYSRLASLVGGGVGKRRLRDTLPFLGLDIESESGDAVRVEYSPNRPDYSTEYGISLGLQGLTGTATGLYGLDIRSSGYRLRARRAVLGVRPFVSCIAAEGGRVDDNLIRQLMAMQEDLHAGLGRGRRRASIGVHDIGKVRFPLEYSTVPRDRSFVPLHSGVEQPVSSILAESEVGRSYGRLLEGHERVPAIMDARGEIVSLPPVINSAMTTVDAETEGLLVEVTGLGSDVVNVVAVLAATLQAAGFGLARVEVEGAGNSTPQLQNRDLLLDVGLANATLGTSMSAAEAALSLERCRLGAVDEGGRIRCTVPPHRFDILGEMDLVEEVALGYGIERLSPVLSPPRVLGERDAGLDTLKGAAGAMVGLGYFEALSSSLTSRGILYDTPGRDPSGILGVMGSKSREHTILRDAILPGLLDSLSRNVHEPYPQRLFEIGTVFLRSADAPHGIAERTRMACVDASRDASFSGIKSVLQAALRATGGCCSTLPVSCPPFWDGRTARIVLGGRDCGYLGEIDQNLVDRLKIRVPVAAFEVDLEPAHSVYVSPGSA